MLLFCPGVPVAAATGAAAATALGGLGQAAFNAYSGATTSVDVSR